MKPIALAAFLAVILTESAWADEFKVGDRVRIGSANDMGTVVEVGPRLVDGGTQIKVHLDRFGQDFPNVGVAYDTKTSNVTVTGHGAPPSATPAAPVAVLPGMSPSRPSAPSTPAPARPAAAPSQAGQSGVALGRYKCWYFSTPLPGMYFTLQSGGRYVGSDGTTGTYEAVGGRVMFHGSTLDGQWGNYRPGPPPTVGIQGTGGRETESCQIPS